MKEILDFLRELRVNNNREWFNAHKADFEIAKKEFEKICQSLIVKIGEFDEKILNVSPQECVFRIYRDIRFTHDKTPYKNHFGCYIAFPGGRKSSRGGYYLHIDPVEGCFLGVGIWSPEPAILKALRESIYENYEEFDEIISEPEFRKIFGNSFYSEEKLKSIPKGFSADFPNPEILKLKHYLVSHDLTEEEVNDSNFADHIANLARIAYPLNKFLNYTVDELTL